MRMDISGKDNFMRGAILGGGIFRGVILPFKGRQVFQHYLKSNQKFNKKNHSFSTESKEQN